VSDDTLANVLFVTSIVVVFGIGFIVGASWGYHNLAGATETSLVVEIAKAL
jgi:hypothetical protein